MIDENKKDVFRLSCSKAFIFSLVDCFKVII